MTALDNFLFTALPYTTMIIFLVGTIYRYKSTSFKYSSLSSQFLEGRQLFWGSIPFHWGIIFLFIGHFLAFLIPDTVLSLNSHPFKLLLIEISAFMFGLSVLIGLITLLYRRISNKRLWVVTTKMDIFVELLLLAQIILGLWMAYSLRWGSSWFASVLTPYLRSIFLLQPDINAVSNMPWLVKFHIIGSFLIFILIPFSRLVHILVVPLHYLWRPYQRVIWYWDRRMLRHPDSKWSVKSPKST